MVFPTRTRIFLGALLTLAAACSICVGWSLSAPPPGRKQCSLVVRELGLSDLALWYEAMHTRHPSQADLFAPFGDFPGAPEHFPSGSLAPPLRQTGPLEPDGGTEP